MTVAFQAARKPASAMVEWGLSEQYASGRTVVEQADDGAEGHRFFWTLKSLPPDQRIYYRVVLDGESQSGTFRATPSPGARQMTFYAFGDTRAGLSIENRIAGRVLTDMSAEPETRQTFLLHTGDYVLCGLVEEYWDTEMFKPQAFARCTNCWRGCRCLAQWATTKATTAATSPRAEKR